VSENSTPFESAIGPPLVMIGASIGGPGTLEQILRRFPAGFPGAILIAQHMPEGKTAELADHLSRHTKVPVLECANAARVVSSHVYIAPGRHNMVVHRTTTHLCLTVTEAEESQVFVPSIDQLFCSGAAAVGSRSIGVVLTGIGNDGTEGLRAIRQVGGVTLAESEASAVVFGMPKHAIDSNVVDTVLPKNRLGAMILGLLLSWASGEE